MSNVMKSGVLARRINQPLLILYGLGTILGAGIYVLIGKVASLAGMLAPLSFIFAAFIAWLTALSYSKLVVLFPKSAGEAVYIEKSFQQHWLTLLVGFLIIFTGIISAATLARGFTGYFVLLVPIDESFAITGVIIVLAGLAIWGIAESLTVAALVTIIEVLGLFIVLFFSSDALINLPGKFDQLFIPTSFPHLIGVLSGAFLAFYAFIGFEDMVNVVEEVKQPERTMPKAILWVVIVSTSLYVLVAIVAVLSLPLDQLSQSKAPLAELIAQEHMHIAKLVSLISVLAIINGVLIQMIMASRVCYGMSIRYKGPAWLHWVSPVTKTPVLATLLISLIILLMALFLPLLALAKLTSFVVLIIFVLVNLALWKIQKDQFKQATQESIAVVYGMRSYPMFAAILCFSLLIFQFITFMF